MLLGLEKFETKWGKKYEYAILSWKENWEHLTRYFDLPIEIRKIIYTTNTIENLNRGIRKYTKTKALFVDRDAATKAVFLAIQNIEKKWQKPIKDWGYILRQFIIIFGDRLTKFLDN
ncbi:MAG: transposase [Phycisphaerales bacterium]|nr:transposase [Phycisphaerales bacterium]